MQVLSPIQATQITSVNRSESAQRPSEGGPSRVVSAASTDGQTIEDTLEISAAAEIELATEDQQSNSREDKAPAESESKTSRSGGASKASKSDAAAIGELTEEEQEVVDELRARDREVRAHEQAHLAAAGPYAKGGPTYDYQQGPDGQRYAVGGQVQIDTAPVEGDPEATIAKARVVRAAALAPAEPSAQDRAVAAAATKMEAQALQELRQKQTEQSTEDEPTAGDEQTQAVDDFTSGLLLDLIA